MSKRGDEQQGDVARAALAGVVLLAIAVTVVTGWVDWITVGRWVRPRAALLGLWMLGGLLLAGAGYRWWRTRLPRPGHQVARRPPPLSWWAVAAAALVIAAVAWGATVWLLDEAAAADDPGAARVEAAPTPRTPTSTLPVSIRRPPGPTPLLPSPEHGRSWLPRPDLAALTLDRSDTPMPHLHRRGRPG